MFLRQRLLRTAALCCFSVTPRQGGLAAFSRRKWTSSLGSGFDGSSFSDEEDNPYDEARKMRFGYGEPGSVTVRGHEIDFMVDEFNKELEFMFGATPPSELGTSPATEPNALKRQATTTNGRAPTTNGHEYGVPKSMEPQHQSSLSHVDAAGKAAMVNVAPKTNTRRVAVASGRVLLGSDAFSLVAANGLAKGDVLSVAKIAGIMGAKQTASLIPLCHPLLLSGVDLRLRLNEELHAVDIEATVTTVGPTGVEMEALTAVTVAGLTVYDMCKAVTKDIRITELRLESKTGGKSGDWSRRQT